MPVCPEPSEESPDAPGSSLSRLAAFSRDKGRLSRENWGTKVSPTVLPTLPKVSETESNPSEIVSRNPLVRLHMGVRVGVGEFMGTNVSISKL